MRRLPLVLFLASFLSLAAAQAGQVMTLPIVTQGPTTRCLENGKPPQPNFTVVYKDSYSTCYQDDTQMVNGAFINMKTAQEIAKVANGTLKAQKNGIWQVWFKKNYFIIYPEFYKSGISYVEVTRFISQTASFLRQINMPATKVLLSSFNNPELKFNGNIIKMKQVGNYPLGQELYKNLSNIFIDSLAYSAGIEEYENQFISAYNGNPRTFQTHLAADEAVMALSMRSKDKWNTEVAKVDKLGCITLHGSNTLHFVNDEAYLAPLKKGQPLPTLLIRMTNTPLQNVRSGIINSSNIQAQ